MPVEPNNQKKRRPLKNLPPERFQPKMWIIWFTIIAAVLGLLVFSQSRSPMVKDLKIQEVVDYTAEGKISKGVISDEGQGLAVITGETKDTILDADGVRTNR